MRKMGGHPRLAWVLLASALALGAGPEGVCAQAGRAQVREGNRLYEDGRYQEAHQRYLEALAATPESPLIRYNDANALYKSEDFQRAAEEYQRAIESGDADLAASAWYNLGNALYRQQQLEPSLEAYKQALRLRPDDIDAKHNLERVLAQLQEQQQQQQQQGGQDEQQRDDEQQNQPSQGQQPEDQDAQGAPQEPPGQGEQPQPPGQGEQPPPPGDEQQPGQGEPERRPGQMTEEEAERLLDAIREDPSSVERRRAQATGRVPRRPW